MSKRFAAVAGLRECVLCGAWGVQVAHRNEGKGMSKKVDDEETAALCPQCHREIDNGGELTLDERRRLMDEAIERTNRRLGYRRR